MTTPQQTAATAPPSPWLDLQSTPASSPSTALAREDVAAFLAGLVRDDPRNAIPESGHPPIWEAPLVHVAAADDPLWETLKQPDVVGPLHRSPGEWLAGARSVIVYFLPYTTVLRRGYPKKSFFPSLEWVSGRRNGEVFNNVTRRALVRLVERHGGRAVAPSNEEDYRAEKMRPMWSERHAGFIAGLGTFGIHGALITEKGCSGRMGSIVTDLELAPTPRPYSDIYEYCPYPSSGKCGACIPRCPADAIAPQARDNQKCVVHGRDTVGEHFRPWGYHSCGHCLTWLPCVDRIPPESLRLSKTPSA
ncbi:epoxyqueuosine reductase [Pseudothauera rhizosphaerae]|uniref:Epoxyqueuosine reductase n=1 Tax=Pseudothauera rhizosphaerae TaxID=2565932 RepID=A0A4V3WC15_9RHOO|nr:epoxyqueuosine reductase [Pseudothauera rhizosphaerae]THF65242.1 epoxyqueuosine reductase [Pseudothauera rhizosphaerae]